MPIYEYLCSECDTKFELLRPLSQSSETTSCPTCHQSAKRTLSTFACFSKDESGMSSMIGGGGCSGCSAGTCDGCSM